MFVVLYRGNLQAQNAKGHLVGHIKAIGTDASLEGVRPYTTNIAHGQYMRPQRAASTSCTACTHCRGDVTKH